MHNRQQSAAGLNPFFLGGVKFDLHPRDRKTGAAGLRGVKTRHRADHYHPCFCLPPGIHNRTLTAADDLLIPYPCLGIDWLSHAAEQTEG